MMKVKNGSILNKFLGTNVKDHKTGKERRSGDNRRSVLNHKVESERRKLTDTIIEYLEDELKR